MTTYNPFPVPTRYLSDSAKRAAVDPRLAAWESSAKRENGAILSGETGCGKTLSVARFCQSVTIVTSATWVKWIRADELSRLLSERGSSEQIHQLKSARLLVIDELGYERFPELVLEVLGSRHDSDRPTIVTTGLRMSELKTRYSDATVRRVLGVGSGELVDCWPSSHRAIGGT